MTTFNHTASRLRVGLALALMVTAVGIFAGTANAAGPALKVDQASQTTNLPPGGKARYAISVQNIGASTVTGPIAITDTLPAGVTFVAAEEGANTGSWSCPTAAGATVVECVLNQPLRQSQASWVVAFQVSVDPGASGVATNTISLAGPGGSSDVSVLSSTFSAAPSGFGLNDFNAWALDGEGQPAHQAGSHADLATSVGLNVDRTVFGTPGAAGNMKDLVVDLPPGVVGNPTAIPTCPAALLSDPVVGVRCPPESQVGVAHYQSFLSGLPPYAWAEQPVYNMIPPPGVPARFAFSASAAVIVNIDPVVRSNGDYGISSKLTAISQTLAVTNAKVRLWGVPADPSHDESRGGPSTAPRLPFLSLPSSCSNQVLVSKARVNSWQQPAVESSASTDTDSSGAPFKVEGCGQLDFNPSLEARPTTNLADSPAGLDVRIHIPQSEDPDGLATAHLRDATMTLPAGMSVNPSSANGLGACSPAQVGLTTPVGQPKAQFNEAPVSCPDASKLGTVQIDTPVLDRPLSGAMYLASQNENPFNSLLALYIVIEDAPSGVEIKLAGHPVADPSNGQLTIGFEQNPQLPFEDLKVKLFDGPRAALKTPLTCGNFTTTSAMVPWSSPEGATATPSDTFGIVGGAGNGACLKAESEAPNTPSFSAGTADPAAGTFTPFVLKLVRADGTQPIKAIDTTLPKGLLGKLAGIPYCSDGDLAAAAGKRGKAEQSSSSCPPASQVGSVTVGAGAGSAPFYASGKAYLGGPYKGAPLSLAVVVPAVAGPFDLGTVVVRNKLEVNPETAQVRAVSDELPTILQGIPLDVRSIAVSLDRPSFTLNPTSCNPMSVLGGATSVFNQTASLSSPFQVGGCGALGFKPSLAFKLSGQTRRTGFPALRAVLTARPGDANIGRAQVTLPKSQFLAQEHIRTICTRVQFAAKACPPGSVYGKAKAWSPLVDQPLEGLVYLRSSSNPLPDLVASLDGQIHVDLVGRIDSVKERLRSTFESVPDAPVSKFVLEMQGGKKGLLVNNTNLCKAKPKADVQLDAQSGKTYDFNPLVKADCGKKSKKKHKKKSAGKGSKHGSRR